MEIKELDKKVNEMILSTGKEVNEEIITRNTTQT